MTAIRFEIRDDRSRVKVPNGMRSVRENADPKQVAQKIADDFPADWRVKLWFDATLVGSLASLGKPDADVRSKAPK